MRVIDCPSEPRELLRRVGGHFHSNVNEVRRVATRLVVHEADCVLSGSPVERISNALTKPVDTFGGEGIAVQTRTDNLAVCWKPMAEKN